MITIASLGTKAHSGPSFMQHCRKCWGRGPEDEANAKRHDGERPFASQFLLTEDLS